jgi:hypothetical protein
MRYYCRTCKKQVYDVDKHTARFPNHEIRDTLKPIEEDEIDGNVLLKAWNDRHPDEIHKVFLKSEKEKIESENIDNLTFQQKLQERNNISLKSDTLK